MSSSKRRTKGRKDRRDGSEIVLLPASGVPAALRSAIREVRVVRRCLAHSGTLSTSAGGFVVEQAVTGSNAVTNCGMWAAVSATFLEYRVTGIEVDFFPVLNAVSNYTTPPPCMLAVGLYSSGLAGTTYDQIAESPGAKIVNALRPFRLNTSSKGFPDAQLYTAANASVPAANVYGVIISSDSVAPAGPASQVVIRWTARYLVEFRSFL